LNPAGERKIKIRSDRVREKGKRKRKGKGGKKRTAVVGTTRRTDNEKESVLGGSYSESVLGSDEGGSCVSKEEVR